MRFLLDEGCEAGIANESGKCKVAVPVGYSSEYNSCTWELELWVHPHQAAGRSCPR